MSIYQTGMNKFIYLLLDYKLATLIDSLGKNLSENAYSNFEVNLNQL